MGALRILHFSDIHISIQIRQMHWQKWFSKRAIGALNLIRGRAKYFRQVEAKLNALAQFAQEQQVDLVLNTGDYTALGLEVELDMAKKLVQPLMQAPLGYITVPGNHDLYVSETGRCRRRFCQKFNEFLQSDLPEYCAEDHWPQVRLIHDDLAVIALNSARPSPVPWASSGRISDAQMRAFAHLLQDERLRSRFLIIMTHYAPRLADGRDDKKLHGLRNADQLLSLCRPLPRAVILCGHIHHRYHVVVPEGPTGGIYCAGSATMERREGLWLYEFNQGQWRAYPVNWQDHRYQIAADLVRAEYTI